MTKRKNKLGLFALLWCFLLIVLASSFLNGTLYGEKGNFFIETLFPFTGFYTVDKIGHELSSDLDMVSSNMELFQKWVTRSTYLKGQFENLYKAARQLVAQRYEAEIYLQEDVHYLLTMVDGLSMRYNLILKNLFAQTNREFTSCNWYLEETKNLLLDLLTHNKEIISIDSI